jgi:hypothetical protein
MVKILPKEQAVNEAKIIQLQAGDKRWVSCSGSVVVKLVPTLNTTFYPGFCNIILELGCFNTVVIVVCKGI